MSKRAASITAKASQMSLGRTLSSRPLLPIVILLPVLLIIFTLPGVIALRNVVIFALLVFVTWALASRRIFVRNSDLTYPLLLVVILQVWLLVVSVFIAPDTFSSLREWLGQWLKSAIIFVVGIGAGLAITREIPNRNRVMVAAVVVVLPLAMLALVKFVLAFKYYTPGEGWQYIYRLEYLSGHRANMTYVAALGIPVVLVDLSERLFGRRRLLPAPWLMSIICLGLFFSVLILSGTRNGILVSTVVVLAWMLWVLRHLVRSGRSRVAFVFGVAAGAVLTGPVIFSVLEDSRWNSFVETVEIGWQTEVHAAWYRFQEVPLPHLQDGQPVEESAYLRIAYLKEGMKLLLSHPLGTEVSRDAFRNLLTAKYGKVNVFHSHNGVIDFGLSAGFPGIAIWVLFLGSLCYIGWRECIRRGNAMGLVLLIVVLSFFLRMFIDSTLREHILQQFMLVAGLLVAVSMPIQEPSRNE